MVVQAPRGAPQGPAHVLEQAHALGGDRGADLGCLRHALDQLLRLVARHQPPPEPVDELGVEHLDGVPLDRLTLQREVHDPVDAALDQPVGLLP